VLPEEYQVELFEYYKGILAEFHSGHANRFDLAFFTVLHQLCKIIVSNRNKGRLREYICFCIGMPSQRIEYSRHPFSWRRLTTRYYVISLALWIMMEPSKRLEGAWKAGAVRSNTLLKDFAAPPKWYAGLAQRFNSHKTKMTMKGRQSFER